MNTHLHPPQFQLKSWLQNAVGTSNFVARDRTPIFSHGASRLAALTSAAVLTTGSALAQGAPGEGSPLASFIPLILIIAVFYWLLIRPQQKRAKAHREMLTALSVGDEVLTAGGIFGKVVKITDNAVVLEVGKSQIPFQKQSIQSLLPAGSLEKL